VENEAFPKLKVMEMYFTSFDAQHLFYIKKSLHYGDFYFQIYFLIFNIKKLSIANSVFKSNCNY